MEKLLMMWRDRGNQKHYAKWLMRYSKPYIWKITLVMLINFAVSMISVVGALISKKIIDSANMSKTTIMMIVLYTLIMVAMVVFTMIQSLMSIMLNEKFSFGIRKQIYDKIIRSNWMAVSKYHTGDLMTRLTSDAGNISDGIVTTIPNIIKLSFELIVVFFTLFFYSKLLAVLALTMAPISVLICFVLGRKMKRLQVKVQESEASYRSFLQESLANLLIIKAFTNEEQSMKKLVELRENRFYWVYKRSKLGVISSSVMSLTFQLGYIGAFAFGAYQIANDSITFGTMTIFLTLVNRIQAPIMQIAEQLPRIVSIFASAGRIIELQNIPLEEKEEQVLHSKDVGVSCRDLSFGYTKELVLENANFDINPSEFVAIVGESGIGKTTLIRILMSFLESEQGDICYWNYNGSTENLNAGNRSFISYVPQGNTLFSGTIRDNILTGKEDATEAEVNEAVNMSCSASFINELPDGLDTVVGERGHGLSEGQAQRIAIARALIRKSPFLILDEATSALDERTELAVLAHIRAIKPRPTCILITHRKSVLQYCDRELVIKDKKIEFTDELKKEKIGS